jgi:diguanylate cyclase (GGDEF)-like protein
MDPLRSALAALASATEAGQSLAQTVAFVECEFAHALGAEGVTIRIGDAERVNPPRVWAETVALVLDGRNLGFATFRFRSAPGDSQREAIRAIAAPLAVLLAWRGQTGERDRLHGLLRIDALTGLANRMAFDERLDAAWRSCAERGTSLSVALLDIDYFKIYNDMNGHVAGDDCLRAVAAMLATEATRENGFIARYGGEEFAFIAEALSPAQTVAAIGRLVAAFEDRPISHRGSTLGRISMSAGVASGVPSPSNTIADFVREADRSLYRAKALGRNRICAGSYASRGPVVSRHSRSVCGPPVFEDTTVGRDADIARVIAALRQARMVSLVGPPGIGKSRLGCLAGVAAQQFMSDGVAYVDFSLLSAECEPAALVGASLDLALEAGNVREELCDAVKERHSLIVLDNVPETAARGVAELCGVLLSASPSLSILATSRAALGCADERTVVVSGLGEDAAVELLRIRSGVGAIAELRAIARALEGNPAAIEDASRRLVPA